MPEEWSFVAEFHPPDAVAMFPNFQNDFDNVVDVALRVDAARDCQTNQIHLGSRAKHQRADFYRTNTSFEIEFIGECNGGKVIGRYVG